MQKKIELKNKLEVASNKKASYTEVKDEQGNVVDYKNVSFEGYACQWGTNENGYTFTKESYPQKVVDNFLRNGVLMLSHNLADTKSMAGSISTIDINNTGMYVTGKISDSPEMLHVRFLMVEGHLKTISTHVFAEPKPDSETGKVDENSVLIVSDLLEISLVPVPGDREAEIILNSKNVSIADAAGGEAEKLPSPTDIDSGNVELENIMGVLNQLVQESNQKFTKEVKHMNKKELLDAIDAEKDDVKKLELMQKLAEVVQNELDAQVAAEEKATADAKDAADAQAAADEKDAADAQAAAEAQAAADEKDAADMVAANAKKAKDESEKLISNMAEKVAKIESNLKTRKVVSPSMENNRSAKKSALVSGMDEVFNKRQEKVALSFAWDDGYGDSGSGGDLLGVDHIKDIATLLQYKSSVIGVMDQFTTSEAAVQLDAITSDVVIYAGNQYVGTPVDGAPSTANSTLALVPVTAWVQVNDSVNDFGSANYEVKLKAQIMDALAKKLDSAAVNGDTSTTHMDRTNGETPSFIATPETAIGKGLRYYGLSTSGLNVDISSNGASIEGVKEVIALGGDYMLDTEAPDTTLIMPASAYNTFRTDMVNTYHLTGAMNKGVILDYFGSPVRSCRVIPTTLATDGYYGEQSGDVQTKTNIIAFNGPKWAFVKHKKGVEIEIFRSTTAFATVIRARVWVAFGPKITPAIAPGNSIVSVGYNL